ncbi:MAG: beta-lactamase family protein [Desulfobacterales bacterium]|nr:beta-lactamase family protein [Desulfobacterales bacterium]
MMFQSVEEIMYAGISDTVFPGAVLFISKDHHLMFHRAYGIRNIYTRESMSVDTIFDLASLTKPLATTLAIMKLYELQLLELSVPLHKYLPETQGTDKSDITINQLLLHTSGLPAYKPYYKELDPLPHSERKQTLLTWIINEPLINPIGQRCVYSDIGFMVLLYVIERLTQTSFDCFVKDAIYSPLNLKGFLLPCIPKKNQEIAATEYCSWRHQVLEGIVHDENAYVVGGYHGHAGLFGTAWDVYELLAILLYHYQKTSYSPLLSTNTIRDSLFQFKPDHRCLGFDIRSTSDSSSGHFFSTKTVGHLGFTGTSFWMDLNQNVIVILLSNRVHPTRENNQIKKFRPLLHDQVMRCIFPELSVI